MISIVVYDDVSHCAVLQQLLEDHRRNHVWGNCNISSDCHYIIIVLIILTDFNSCLPKPGSLVHGKMTRYNSSATPSKCQGCG